MNASAFVVTPNGSPGTLLDTAQALDFEAALLFRSVAAAERQAQRTPLVYFFFDAGTDLRVHAATVSAIRGSSHPAIRFAPLICFARTPSRDTVRACINMGFDDIVTLPCSRPRLQKRLARQLGSPCYYYETGSYFGPDRRNRLRDSSEHSGRGRGGPFRRYEILRSALTGVRLVSDEQQVVV